MDLKPASATAEQHHMPLFRTGRDDEPVDMNARSPQLGIKYKDLAVLDQLMKAGADLSSGRHVLYCCYAPSEPVAHAMADGATARGFSATVHEPVPQYPDQWSVLCEINAVTSPDFVRESDDFFEGLAGRHGGEYDGWEASV